MQGPSHRESKKVVKRVRDQLNVSVKRESTVVLWKNFYLFSTSWRFFPSIFFQSLLSNLRFSEERN